MIRCGTLEELTFALLGHVHGLHDSRRGFMIKEDPTVLAFFQEVFAAITGPGSPIMPRNGQNATCEPVSREDQFADFTVYFKAPREFIDFRDPTDRRLPLHLQVLLAAFRLLASLSTNEWRCHRICHSNAEHLYRFMNNKLMKWYTEIGITAGQAKRAKEHYHKATSGRALEALRTSISPENPFPLNVEPSSVHFKTPLVKEEAHAHC